MKTFRRVNLIRPANATVHRGTYVSTSKKLQSTYLHNSSTQPTVSRPKPRYGHHRGLFVTSRRSMATQAPPAAPAATKPQSQQKRIHSLVVDTGPLINNAPSTSTLIAQADHLYTLPSVLAEIKVRPSSPRLSPLSCLPLGGRF